MISILVGLLWVIGTQETEDTKTVHNLNAQQSMFMHRRLNYEDKDTLFQANITHS